MTTIIAEEGDTIEWSFEDVDKVPKIFRGKTYQAKVALVSMEDKHYGVYATYGMDYVDFESVTIVNKNLKI